LRLLADENVHGGIVAGLRAAGHDVLWIAETQPGTGDEDVLGQARHEERVLLTFDRDFGELIIRRGFSPPSGVLYLRLPRTAVNLALQRLGAVLDRGEAIEGSLIVIAPAKERRRKLALRKQDENG
jgi:predicted nuclease of predicted toxin-antitoxin system